MKIILKLPRRSVYERGLSGVTFFQRLVKKREAIMLKSNRDFPGQASYFRYEFALAVQVAVFCLFLWPGKILVAQTAATGALKGVVADPSGSVVSGASVKVTSYATGQERTVVTQSNGSYLVPYLEPGNYKLEVSARGFKTLAIEKVEIHVTEVAALDLRLQVGAISETITVRDVPELLQTDSSALGNVTDQRMVENLPLVTRNYMQILGLSPGVSSEITDAASIGRGNVGLEFSTSGNIVNDNNFQMNGSEVNDLMGSGNLSGVFLKQSHQPRGVLNENQFGGTLGGPILKDKLFFFVSYQGTREKDGLDVAGGCLSGGTLPTMLTKMLATALRLRWKARLALRRSIPLHLPC